MREPRNPFKMRASEHIESDATFLRFFGPGVLDLLPKDDLWNKVQIFRSAPGGGKTSLFRVFTPSSLVTLYGYRSNEDYNALYERMKEIEAVSDNGPQVLGIMLSFARNYALLEDFDFDSGKKERLFYALLNSRLILAALRGVLAIKRLQFPADLDRLNIVEPSQWSISSHPIIPSGGRDLFQWACDIEKRICETIDSFVPAFSELLEGHTDLYALSLIRPECIQYNGVPVANRVVVMLDDTHKLSAFQRQKLLARLFCLRLPIGVWIAERLEALSPNELLDSGSITGRDYGKPINLEDFWRPSQKRFEKSVTDIADRRVKSAREVQISSFAGCLEESLNEMELQGEFDKAIKVIYERIRKRDGSNKRYEDWIKSKELIEGSPHDKAIEWRRLEILIERDRLKAQQSFDFSLSEEELMEREEPSGVKSAAEFLVSQEFNIPHYFGMSRLASLSSSNIEQFLAFAGELFEENISQAILKKTIALTPDRQESILKKGAKQRWEEIPRRIQNGRDVHKFLEAIGEYARRETNRPNAPYAPGVTGIAISMADRDRLLNNKILKEHPEYKQLVDVLSSCISHNMLEVSLDRSQGQKGKTWMLLYLNRWLCLHFKLPLQYGGWRQKTPDELCKWLEPEFIKETSLI